MQTMFEDFIGIFDESVSNQLCNTLVELFDFCSIHIFTVENMEGSVKADEQLYFPPFKYSGQDQKTISVHDMSISNDVCNEYWSSLNDCFNEYTKKYHIQNRKLTNHAWKIHKVEPSKGFHAWHAEQVNSFTIERVLVFMTYLKIPEEGGETEFLHQSKRFEPVVGRTLIWPAQFTHFHRGNPPLKGIKYYLTGWFEDVKI